ncbi:MAG: glycosyltransferase family 4 protein [Halothiobacillaceae bacterium]
MDDRGGLIRVHLGTTRLAQGLSGGASDGLAVYGRHLLEALSARDDVSVTAFGFGTRDQQCAGTTIRGMPGFLPQALTALAGLDGFSALERTLEAGDLVHATDHLIPRCRRAPVIATLMDALPLSNPEWANPRWRRLKNILWKRSTGWADHVIAPSKFARDQVVQHFGLPEDRVSIVPLGVDSVWFEPPDAGRMEAIRLSLNLPPRYLLFVGTLQPRKNLTGAIDAWLGLPAERRAEFPLLVVGRAGPGSQRDLARLAKRADDGPRWLGTLPFEQLHAALHGAAALLLPSLYEGFGLPVLEAFAAGVPVMTSQSNALGEVGGDAAWLVDPRSPAEMTAALGQILDNPGAVDAVVSRARARAQAFTWARTANETVAVYRRVLGT